MSYINDYDILVLFSPGSGFREPRSQQDGLTATAELEMPAAPSASENALGHPSQQTSVK